MLFHSKCIQNIINALNKEADIKNEAPCLKYNSYSPLIGEQMLQLASMISYHMAINIYVQIQKLQ